MQLTDQRRSKSSSSTSVSNHVVVKLIPTNLQVFCASVELPGLENNVNRFSGFREFSKIFALASDLRRIWSNQCLPE